jgi:hypothetical protein
MNLEIVLVAIIAAVVAALVTNAINANNARHHSVSNVPAAVPIARPAAVRVVSQPSYDHDALMARALARTDAEEELTTPRAPRRNGSRPDSHTSSYAVPSAPTQALVFDEPAESKRSAPARAQQAAPARAQQAVRARQIARAQQAARARQIAQDEETARLLEQSQNEQAEIADRDAAEIRAGRWQ